MNMSINRFPRFTFQSLFLGYLFLVPAQSYGQWLFKPDTTQPVVREDSLSALIQTAADSIPERSPDTTFSSVLHLVQRRQYRRALMALLDWEKQDSANGSPLSLALKVQLLRETNHPEEAGQEARRFLATYPVHPLRAHMHFLLGDMAVDQGNYVDGLMEYLRARQTLPPDSRPDTLDQRILRLLDLAAPAMKLDSSLSAEFRNLQPDLISFLKAYQDLWAGNIDQAALDLATVDRSRLTPPYDELYDRLLLISYEPGKPTLLVGAILPLEGETADAGRALLDGMKKMIRRVADSPVRIRLLVENNFGDPLETIRLAQKLAANPLVKLIIAPPADQTAILTVNTLSGKNIPVLVPLTTTPGLADLTDWTLQFNGDEIHHGRALAHLCYSVLDLKEMAVLAPGDSWGVPLVKSFVDEYTYLGGNILIQEWYSGVPENLRRQFLSIRKVAWEREAEATKYDAFLGMEIDSLEGLFEVTDETFFDLPETEEPALSPSDSNKVELNTIPGLLLPIHPEDINYVATQFPLYNLNTVVVGTEGWQNLDVLNQDIVGPHIQGLTTLAQVNPEQREDPDLLRVEKNQRLSFLQGKDIIRFLTRVVSDSVPTRESLGMTLAGMRQVRLDHRDVLFSGEGSLVNQGYHVYRYENRTFLDQGFLDGDTLLTAPGLTP
ncbi:MAG: hypothetical protein D6762_02160 [Candidatus Neomarinimicrobiota bacterium]|nr:MAG: hypothetical protein D6762_02160 [Candidatus Neomarinimicrobiota bacterium]